MRIRIEIRPTRYIFPYKIKMRENSVEFIKLFIFKEQNDVSQVSNKDKFSFAWKPGSTSGLYESENPDPHKGDAYPYKNEEQFLRHKDCLEHESVNIHIGVAAEVVLPLTNLSLIENIWLRCEKIKPVFLTGTDIF